MCECVYGVCACLRVHMVCVCVRGGLTRGQGAVVEGGLEAHAVSVGAAGGGAQGEEQDQPRGDAGAVRVSHPLTSPYLLSCFSPGLLTTPLNSSTSLFLNV